MSMTILPQLETPPQTDRQTGIVMGLDERALKGA